MYALFYRGTATPVLMRDGTPFAYSTKVLAALGRKHLQAIVGNTCKYDIVKVGK